MKITLADAAYELESICDEIDKREEIGPLLQKAFTMAKDTLEETVDRRIRYLTYAENSAKQAREMAQKWTERARTLETSAEWIKENTLQVMKLNPELPYKGQLGSFKVYKNSVPSLQHDVSTTVKSFEIIESTIKSKLPAEYITFQAMQIVDKEKIKNAITAGLDVPGARFESGEHVRITLEKK